MAGTADTMLPSCGHFWQEHLNLQWRSNDPPTSEAQVARFLLFLVFNSVKHKKKQKTDHVEYQRADGLLKRRGSEVTVDNLLTEASLVSPWWGAAASPVVTAGFEARSRYLGTCWRNKNKKNNINIMMIIQRERERTPVLRKVVFVYRSQMYKASNDVAARCLIYLHIHVKCVPNE